MRRSSIPAKAQASAPTGSGKSLDAVGLPQLAARLEEEAHWNRMLSLGEQQRLGLARALLHTPSYLFLDEATASLDEPSEAALYHLLDGETAGRPPSSRSVIARRWKPSMSAMSTLVRDGDHFTLREGKPA